MKKYMLSLIVLVVAVAAMAFTNVAVPVPAEEAVAVRYEFIGDDMEDVYELDFWREIDEEDNGPSCGGQDLPCVVTVQSGTLQNWLNSKNEEQILDQATSLKD